MHVRQSIRSPGSQQRPEDRPFLITGADLERFDNDYRTGRALVNPLELCESLNHMRDVMFEKLRENDPP
jgi:hypothetical protein